jgi:hypothetical protein
MNPIQARKFMLILGALTLLLSACGPSDSELTPTVNPDAIRTEAVGTYASSLTETALAVPTATLTLTPSPTNTAPAVSTAFTATSSAVACYRLLYVADVTIPDNTQMVAGQTFTKTWRVQNTGGCAWAPGFKFSLVGGDAMGGQALTLTQPVASGATTEISVAMVAPTGKTGTIQGTWRMADANGALFGESLTVVIVIGGAATAIATTGTGSTAAPTSTATPTPTSTP